MSNAPSFLGKGWRYPVLPTALGPLEYSAGDEKIAQSIWIILDTDLAKVDLATFMAGKAHPGKDRPSGFFGFAGHNDPVAFKDISIKKL